MPLPILPLLALGGSLFLLTREQEKPIGPQPHFPPEALARIAITKPLEGGGSARYFRPEVSRGIVEDLAGYALEAVSTDALPPGSQPPGVLLRLIRLSGPVGTEHTAQQIAVGAQAEGFVVLATLSTFLGSGEKLMLLCRQGDRRLASQGSHWAVLLDAAGVPKIEEVVPQAAPVAPVAAGPSPFDADLPTEVALVLAGLLTSDATTPDALLEAAQALPEGKYEVTRATLVARAEALALRDRVRRAAGTPVPVAEARTEVAAAGAGEAAVVIGSVMNGETPARRNRKKDAGEPAGETEA